MLFSKACLYGLRAALYIATVEEKKYVSIREISERLDISFHFLTKILQSLTQKGIMVSYKGPKGGVALAKPADRILLKDIMETIDGDTLFAGCVMGLPGCGSEDPCPLHDAWADIRDRIISEIAENNLQELAQKIDELGLRLSDSDVNLK